MCIDKNYYRDKVVDHIEEIPYVNGCGAGICLLKIYFKDGSFIVTGHSSNGIRIDYYGVKT